MIKQTCKLKPTQIYQIQHLIVFSVGKGLCKSIEGENVYTKDQEFLINGLCTCRQNKMNCEITMSLSRWQLNGSCLPLLCSICLHVEVRSVGDTEIYIRGSNGRGVVRVQSGFQRAIAFFSRALAILELSVHMTENSLRSSQRITAKAINDV